MVPVVERFRRLPAEWLDRPPFLGVLPVLGWIELARKPRLPARQLARSCALMRDEGGRVDRLWRTGDTAGPLGRER